MKKFKIIGLTVLFALLMPQLQLLAQDQERTYVLLNVSFEGPYSIRELTFTETKTGEEFTIRDLQKIGRRGAPRYFLLEVAAGNYYLSSIAPSINRNDSAPRIAIEQSSGIIKVYQGRLNYIGDVYIFSDEVASGAVAIKELSYAPNSTTLQSAVASETELFKTIETVISIANSEPIPVARNLLGL